MYVCMYVYFCMRMACKYFCPVQRSKVDAAADSSVPADKEEKEKKEEEKGEDKAAAAADV